MKQAENSSQHIWQCISYYSVYFEFALKPCFTLLAIETVPVNPKKCQNPALVFANKGVHINGLEMRFALLGYSFIFATMYSFND